MGGEHFEGIPRRDLNGKPASIPTHSVHSAALRHGEQNLIFKEDIGRHSTVDKRQQLGQQ